MANEPSPMTPLPDCWDVEPQDDGIVLVRVHSSDRSGNPLPDAVFTFRRGDPQYEYWAAQAEDRPRSEGGAVCHGVHEAV
jgi:hypothetical protein